MKVHISSLQFYIWPTFGFLNSCRYNDGLPLSPATLCIYSKHNLLYNKAPEVLLNAKQEY